MSITFSDIVRGYKKPVVFDDLYDLRPTDTCQKTLPTFNNVYFENEDTEETLVFAILSDIHILYNIII